MIWFGLGREGAPSTSTAPTKKFAEVGKVRTTPSPEGATSAWISEKRPVANSARILSRTSVRSSGAAAFCGSNCRMCSRSLSATPGSSIERTSLPSYEENPADIPAVEGGCASCCAGGAGIASDGVGCAGLAGERFVGVADPLACATACDTFADATTAIHRRSIAVRIVEYRFSKQCPWVRAVLTSMECAQLMLYDFLRPALFSRVWPGRASTRILAGKPATYNKGFAHKDFAA